MTMHVCVCNGEKKYVNDTAHFSVYQSRVGDHLLRSRPPGNFVFKSWKIVFTTSGAFQSLSSKQDGGDIF